MVRGQSQPGHPTELGVLATARTRAVAGQVTTLCSPQLPSCSDFSPCTPSSPTMLCSLPSSADSLGAWIILGLARVIRKREQNVPKSHVFHPFSFALHHRRALCLGEGWVGTCTHWFPPREYIQTAFSPAWIIWKHGNFHFPSAEGHFPAGKTV